MAIKFPQCNTFYLAGSGTIVGATTITLPSFTDIYGNVLTMTDFGTKGYITLEPGTTNEEGATFTGITANANLTYTLTGVSSIIAISPYTETSGLVRQHSGGTELVVTDNVAFWNTFGNKQNDEVLTGRWSTGVTPTNPNDLANKSYVDSVAIAGGADASTTVKGISKLSTAPVSGTNPIAVGDNDTRVPTQSENDALAGTSGTPSSTNKYVTNDDTATAATADKVARRLSTGDITVPSTPTNSTDASSKNYVDTQIATLSSSIKKVFCDVVTAGTSVNNATTTVFTGTVPANTYTANSTMRIYASFAHSGSGGGSNTRTFNIKFGGVTLGTVSYSGTQGGNLIIEGFVSFGATSGTADARFIFSSETSGIVTVTGQTQIDIATASLTSSQTFLIEIVSQTSATGTYYATTVEKI